MHRNRIQHTVAVGVLLHYNGTREAEKLFHTFLRNQLNDEEKCSCGLRLRAAKVWWKSDFFYERHLSPKVKGGANLSRIELLVYLS